MLLTDTEFEQNHQALYDALLAAYDAQGRFVALGQQKQAQLLNVVLFANLTRKCS